MYRDSFGLRDSPFGLTPDPRYLFLTDAHKEAIASVIYGLQERKGFVLILGEVGTGKTTVIRHILGRLGPSTKAAFVFNPAIGFDELLRIVLRELEVPCRSGLRSEMVEAFHRFLLDEAVAGRVVALIIDEAQHLSSAVLEELRMLSNLETTRSKLLQIVLVGQPELGMQLARPELRQVRQRIGLVAELRPLTRSETREYILHRLEVAGAGDRTIFTRGALRRIHRRSEGIPRLINVICDRALILAYGAGRLRVNRRSVGAAVKGLATLHRPAPESPSRSRSRAARARFRQRPVGRRLTRIAAAVLLPLIGAAALVLTAPRTADLVRAWRPETASPGATGDIHPRSDQPTVSKPQSHAPGRSEATHPVQTVAVMGSVSAKPEQAPSEPSFVPVPAESFRPDIVIPPAPPKPTVPLVANTPQGGRPVMTAEGIEPWR